ncbi:MAG: ATP-binding cassette domain-containing protein [Chloroflexota bacterium]|nr:ATP-binding cassette domain-containing protein [Chloroflexota bacterium]
MAILIQAAQVAYAHGGNRIFTDVNFELQEGDRAALIGENGAGKSTLFRLLAKELEPDRGAVTHRRGLTIGYLTQEPNLDPKATVESLLQSAVGDPDAVEARIEQLQARLSEPLDDDEMMSVLEEHGAMLERLDVLLASDKSSEMAEVTAGLGLRYELMGQPFATLSGGEKKLVALARFAMSEPDVLLLDEPDNHLDANAKFWLEGYLARYKGAVGLISHDRYTIDRVANEIFEIEDGKIQVYPGNYSQFQQLKRDRLERALELRELAEREFKKLKESAEELTQWARQNPKFATRAEAMRNKMAAERARLDAEKMPVLTRRKIKVEFDADRGGSLVLEAKDAAKAYGDRTVLKPFDFEIRHGERVGIVGANGAGKTTLFRMAMGVEPATSGSFRLGASIVPGYYSQEHETLDPNATPINVVRKIKPLNEQQALSFLVGFLFERDDVMNRIGSLSGGERSRLQVATLILQGANFLLLDEPTNNLDLGSVEVLEDALLDFNGTILTISHDRFFLDKICTRIVEIRDGILRDYPGNYSWYQQNPEKGTILSRGEQPTKRALVKR